MKKIILTVLVMIVLLALVSSRYLGVSPSAMLGSVRVGASLSAKIACSAKHISGFDDEQIRSDLSSYSAALDNFSLVYDENHVTASLFGLMKTSATFRPGLGCSLDIGDTSALDKVKMSVLTAQAADWPKGEAVSSIQVAVQTKLEALLAADNRQALNTRALLVIKRGEIIAEAYGQGSDKNTPLLGWSMAKSITAIMLGQLIYRGELEANETILFPEWQTDARADIDLPQMLNMASGLDFNESYTPPSDATEMLFMAHSASDYAKTSELKYTPASHFSYSSGTANLLARLYHDRQGGDIQTTFDKLRDQLLLPLGVSNIWFEPDSSGVFVGSSYLYASARDWARFGQLMLNGGEINGQRLLSTEWVAAASRPNNSANDPRYGYQFWLNGGGEQLRWQDLPADAYAMSGNRAQTVMIIPSADVILVRLGWTSGSYPANDNLSEILSWVL